MRQRLPDSPQRPTPKPSSLVRRLLKLLRRLLINLFKLFRWLALIVIGLLALWIVGGSLLADQQEKRVDQAREQFIQQFSSIDANDSALKLEELSAGLGFGRWLGTNATPTRYLHLPASQVDKKIPENLRKDLDQYLDSQFDQPNDDIDAPPETVRQYLSEHAAELEAIRMHVLSSDLPRWELDMSSVGDVLFALPTFLGSANFQKVLAVDILDKTRQGQTQAALKTLEVSWKLNQVWLERPEFIGQLVVIINSRSQASVMRKMQGLPTEWQDRIARFNQYDLPQAYLRGLYSEAFYSVSARKYPAIYLFHQFALFEAIDSSSGGSSDGFSVALPQWLSSLFDPLLKPYVRLSAVDHFDRMRQAVLKLPEQDFCTFNPDEFEKQLRQGTVWWSIFPSGGWAGQWHKVGKAVLRFELTQKVLQVKTLAAKQGRLPKQIPGIESSVCRDGKWIYQLTPNGTASISFNKDLEWMKYRSNPDNPLQYEPGNRLQYSFKSRQSNPTPVP